MNPAENIYFLFLAFAAFIVIFVSWLFLRKRKKWAWIVTGVIVVIYMSWYFYYPTYREVTHAERYEQLLIYLDTTYPQQQFIVEPEVYEAGYQVGDFSVQRVDTPTIGVMLRVKDDAEVVQTSTWDNSGYPNQQTLWQEIAYQYHVGSYTLAQAPIQVEKKDSWLHGEMTVFAVTIDGRPALAFYQYDKAGYSSEPLVEGEPGAVVSAEWQNRLFVYIDEAYSEEEVVVSFNGETVALPTATHQGKLVVLE